MGRVGGGSGRGRRGPGRGRSPRWLTSSTIGDEIIAASGGRARAFAVAAKDRAAQQGGTR